jgi:hypothetical protein
MLHLHDAADVERHAGVMAFDHEHLFAPPEVHTGVLRPSSRTTAIRFTP